MSLHKVPCAVREWCDGAHFNMAVMLCLDSPSIMDISITSETEEKAPNVNNVPDYISEIYTYLREMEVSCCLSSYLHTAHGGRVWGGEMHLNMSYRDSD